MNITIEICTDNAAFDDWHGGEIRRLLAGVADDIEAGRHRPGPRPGQHCSRGEAYDKDGTPILDSNGNTCGRVRVRP